MNILSKLFKGNSIADNTAQLAEFLKVDKQALKAFEQTYKEHCLLHSVHTGDIYSANSREASATRAKMTVNSADYADISERVIAELVAETAVMCFDGRTLTVKQPDGLSENNILVSNAELMTLPEPQRPMLTGTLMSVDMHVPSALEVLDYYKQYIKTGDRQFYHRFRQGLDILDLDALMYAMIDTNPNSMSHWLPAIAEIAVKDGFFKVPKTTIAKVPMPVLQLTRKDYGLLTPATFDVIDRYCYDVFKLDVNKEYFIKTGTYSSKFDFRNAYVHGEKEVRELGEYLLFIHQQANAMAGPLSTPSIYGMSTTTEWVVREFIKDSENNPCIYKGLPLHTEYRVFVDFDTDSVLSVTPYWETETMNKRFAENRDNHDAHDAVIYKMHEETLMKRYYANKDKVVAELARILPFVELDGQWSIDVMQNGDDFYIIDMALAETSAFYDTVPQYLRRPQEENWLPDSNIIAELLATNTK